MSQKRSTISLLTAFSFLVLSVTGVLAFALPFSIRIVGLHSLIGFVFIGLIALHVSNNTGHLNRYLRKRRVWFTLGGVLVLAGLFLWQPAPVRGVLGLSRNLGPSLDRFEVTDNGLNYHYVPDADYKMLLNVRTGGGFDAANPPHFVIWLENASSYHIKTLHTPQGLTDAPAALPYWDFKRRGWEEAKREAKASGKEIAEELEVDAFSGASQNSSFDPADYILPENPCPIACSSRSINQTTIRHRSSTPSKSTTPIREPSKRSISSAIQNKKITKTATKSGPSTS